MARVAFDDFEIGDTIGHGTVGTIFRVVQKSTRQEYALKLLLPAVSQDPNIVRRFEREMLILSKLNHPNIVSYVGDGRHSGQLFYVMELILGGTVKDLLQRGSPFSWQETVECGRQIASALQHAHNHGIIHRDLKPGNMFLTGEAQVKLGDFGIARDLRSIELTDAGLTVGTYAYMAPELVRGERGISGQVDLYALGCVLFEMMVGRTPYVGDNFAAIFEQHLHADPPHVRDFVPDCPPALDDLIRSLLAKVPDARPFNARSVQGILVELSESSPPILVETHRRDRAALSVRPGQASLVDRIRRAREVRDVSWKTLGFLSLGVLAAIAAVILLSGR